MPEYRLCVDESTECQEIERALEANGVDFVRCYRESGGTILPSLSGPQGVYDGSVNIKFYFLDRRTGPVAPQTVETTSVSTTRMEIG